MRQSSRTVSNRQAVRADSAAADFRQLAPEGGRVLSALMDGIQADFHMLVG